MHIVVSELKEKKEKNLWNQYFSAGIWFLRQSLEHKLLLLGGENKQTIIGHVAVTEVQKVSCEKQKRDVSKTTIFPQVFGDEYYS